MTAAPGSSDYRADIDGLRALAVTMVVLYHSELTPLSSGFVGVDVFFVISGYLIGGIVFREIRAGQFRFTEFYARRARRIAPALVAVTCVVAALGCVVLDSDELRDLGASAVGALTGTSNVRFYLEHGYFAKEAILFPLLMTWSLGVEEQFYVCLPIALIAIRRFGHRATAILVLAASGASFALSLVQVHRSPAAAFYLLPGRAWELGAGVLLAVVHDAVPRAKQPSYLTEVVAGLGFVAVIASAFAYGPQTRFPGAAALLPITGTAVLLHLPHSAINRHVLSARPAVFVGKLSYSWYLWHWPLLSYARVIDPHPLGVVATLGTLAIGFGLAVLSWRWIERPFRAKRRCGGATLRRYAVVLGAALALPLWAWRSNGWPARLSPHVLAIQAEVAARVGQCIVDLDASRPLDVAGCMPPADGRRAIALVGDSHAAALAAGLAAQADYLHLRLLSFTKSSCTPLENVLQRDDAHAEACRSFLQYSFDRIANDPTITTVVIAAYWTNLDTIAFRSIVDHADLDGVAAVRIGLPPLIQRFEAAGKAVVIVGDVPSFRFDPVREVLARAIPLRGKLAELLEPSLTPRDGVADASLVRTADPNMTALLRQCASADPRTAYVDAFSPFCTAVACRFVQGGELLFVDRHHLSSVGSIKIPWNVLSTRP